MSIITWLVAGLITSWGAGKAPGAISSDRDMALPQLAWHCPGVARVMEIEPMGNAPQISALALSREANAIQVREFEARGAPSSKLWQLTSTAPTRSGPNDRSGIFTTASARHHRASRGADRT